MSHELCIQLCIHNRAPPSNRSPPSPHRPHRTALGTQHRWTDLASWISLNAVLALHVRLPRVGEAGFAHFLMRPGSLETQNGPFCVFEVCGMFNLSF